MRWSAAPSSSGTGRFLGSFAKSTIATSVVCCFDCEFGAIGKSEEPAGHAAGDEGGERRRGVVGEDNRRFGVVSADEYLGDHGQRRQMAMKLPAPSAAL
jgi:hypothetical protein